MIYELTKREYEVLNLLSKGNTNKKIANILKISPRTVESFLNFLYIKVSCKNRLELVVKYNSNPSLFILKKPLENIKIKEILSLYEKGHLDLNQIAERVNSRYHYVWKVINNHITKT